MMRIGGRQGRITLSRHVKVFALISVLALVAMACAGGGGGQAGGGGATAAGRATGPAGTAEEEGGGDEEAGVVEHAAGSTADAYIPQYRAPELFGELFNISTEEHFTAFEEGSLAAQVAVSGQADVASGGFTPVVQVIEAGQEAKAFCPVQKDSTEHLVGRTESITELEEITNPDVRVAVESAGGFLNLLMNLVFEERGLGITTDDLTNTVILEDGSLRLAALASGDVAVGSLDLFEQAELRAELGEDAVTVLSVVAEDVEYLANVMWAPTSWLEENRDLAARYCATILYSNRVLSSDFDQYYEALQEYIEGGVEEETARTNWEFAREHEVFPLNADVLNEENIQTLFDVSIATGIFDESSAELAYEDVVDVEALELAQQYVGGDVTQEQILEGDIPEPDCC
jgi:ABC-type nitrate/sulfonate/bicarbonate transport system substrate-binding protein